MINYFKTGYNFDISIPAKLDEMNQKYSNRVEEVYGSIAEHHKYAARPRYRLPEVSEKDFINHVKELEKYDINFNYTMNGPFIGSMDEVEKDLPEITRILHFLEDTGIKRITVTSPLLTEIIKKTIPKMPLELSTIAHITTVTQLKAYKELLGIDRICMNLEKNRDFKFLRVANKIAQEQGMTINLMVNEFCLSGGKDYCTHCIYRSECYLMHSINVTKEDSMRFDTYPMNRCIMARKSDTYNWLRCRFVLPQWIKVYNDKTGINHFKITGRTGGTPYLLKVIEAYMKQEWNGNVLELWKQLQSIYDGKSNSDTDYIEDNIDASKLEYFIEHWSNNEDFECCKELCGSTCKYCEDFYNMILKN